MRCRYKRIRSYKFGAMGIYKPIFISQPDYHLSSPHKMSNSPAGAEEALLPGLPQAILPSLALPICTSLQDAYTEIQRNACGFGLNIFNVRHSNRGTIVNECRACYFVLGIRTCEVE
jgi:hypothetical protein